MDSSEIGAPIGNIEKLLQIMAQLRNPVGGCPWDLEQDFRSIAVFTIEEAHEVAEAIERGNMDDLAEELGDLLLQVVFHSQMAAELGHFEFADVVEAINDKMVRRHPHVFGDARIDSVQEQNQAWEQHKQAERAAKNGHQDETAQSVLDQVARGLPETERARQLQKRAAQVGFEWPNLDNVFDKLSEEIAELRQEISNGASNERISDELGDVAFVVVNIARHLRLDFGAALRRTNAKFERRFRRIENLALARGASLAQTPFGAQMDFWNQARAEDHQGQLDALGRSGDIR